MIYYDERQQNELSQGKWHVGEVEAQASTSPLSVESYRTCLIPPEMSCDNTCETSTRLWQNPSELGSGRIVSLEVRAH